MLGWLGCLEDPRLHIAVLMLVLGWVVSLGIENMPWAPVDPINYARVVGHRPVNGTQWGTTQTHIEDLDMRAFDPDS